MTVEAIGTKRDPVLAAATRRDPVLAAQGGKQAGLSTDPMSVIVVVLDDIGPEWSDWTGLGGYITDPAFKPAHTPFLSDIANTSGIWFSNHSAESVCSETRVAINFGLYPHKTGVGFNMRDPGSALGSSYLGFGYAAGSGETALPAWLRTLRPDITTAAFGKWHMCDGYSAVVASGSDGAPLSGPNVNLTHYSSLGYQTQDGNISNVGGNFSWWDVINGTVQSKISAPPFNTTTYPNSVIAGKVATWLGTQTGPFFAYVALGPPHEPFTVPPQSLVSASTWQDLVDVGLGTAGTDIGGNATYADTGFPEVFRASIEASDTTVAAIWAAVPAALKPFTTLIVTGDNGTVANALVPGFTHFKRQLNGGGTFVPMVMRGPGVARVGREVKQVTHVCDIFPTVCNLFGLSLTNNAHTPPVTLDRDGVSFMPAVQDAVDRSDVNALRSHILLQNFLPVGTTNTALWIPSQRQRCVYDGRYRYLNVAGVEYLYDDVVDFVEANNTIASDTANATRLRAIMASELPV